MSEARLWTGGRVFTGRRYVEALLVDDGVVVTAGSESDARRAAPAGTEVVPLEGRLVVPGLVDAHLHVGDLTRFREGLDLSGVRGPGDLADRLRAWAAAHPDGSVVGRGLDVERSLAGRWPRREDLDRAVADRPVVVVQSSGHAAIVNSTAFAALGLDQLEGEGRDRIGRNADGSPNGILREEALRRLGPLLGSTVDAEAVARTLGHLASLGLTTVATMNVAPEELGPLRSLAAESRLPIRVRAYVRLLRIREFPSSALAPVGRPGRFAVVGTKGFTDGAFGPRTAWLSDPYADRPEESGIPVESDAAISDALAVGRELGLAPALHAIGDRAVLRAVRLLAPFAPRGPPVGPLARLEHVALTPPPVLAALGEVRPALVVQPGFVWSDFWLTDRLGPARTRWAYAFRTLSDSGHLLVGSSDAPYDPVDPWRGLRAATERRDGWGRSANPDPREALALEEALGLYTEHGGRALGEPTLGTLEPGGRADLVVLSVPTLSEALRVGAPAVRETWVEGARIHPPAASPSAVS